MSSKPNQQATRASSAAAQRREALIDCAQELFFTAGYDPTTINDIIIKAGISKGGFYHHFSAKEDLLEAVVERMTQTIISGAANILTHPGADALQRLNSFIAHSSSWKVAAAPQLRAISLTLLHPENTALFQRILASVSLTLMPLLESVIRAGVSEGVFDAHDPMLAAEVFISMSNARRSVIRDAINLAETGDIAAASSLLNQRLAGEAAIIERILGVATGAITLMPASDTHALFAAMCSPTR